MKLNVSFLDTLEEQIRTNKAPKLEQLVRTFQAQEIPRTLVVRYANLLRRMGGTKHALRILNPVVRNDTEKPTIDEVIEYASCLTRLSLVDESIALLSKIDNEPKPEIQYELAAAYVAKWDYSKAIPYLKKYLSFTELSPYKICVGEINLAAAFIYTNELEKADSLLKKLLTKIQQYDFKLLWGNVLELQGEIAFINREFDRSMDLFRESGEKLQSSNPRYLLYIDKWKVISKMLKENGTKTSLLECAGLRKKAAELRDWNSLREIELYRALVTNDSEAIANLYYGVPYPEYRKRILSIWAKPLKVNGSHERRIGPGMVKIKKIFDVAAGKDLFTDCQLKPGQTLHRLVQVLATDFYSPFSTTKIFSLVFKDSFFNPVTSPQQVYEIVKRLNEWFVENKIPLIVTRGKWGYRLRAEEAYFLRLQIDSEFRTKIDDFIESLENYGLVENFSVSMVEEKTGLARRTATRLLSDGVAAGKLLREGRAQSTKYSLVKNKLG